MFFFHIFHENANVVRRFDFKRYGPIFFFIICSARYRQTERVYFQSCQNKYGTTFKRRILYNVIMVTRKHTQRISR